MNQLNFDAQFHDLFDYSSDLIHFLDLDGNIITVNPSWLRTLGYNLEEVIGKSIYEFLMPAHVDHYRGYRAEVLKRRRTDDINFSVQSKTGAEIVLEGHIGWGVDGNKRQYTRGVFRNNTEKHKAAMAIAKNERWLTTVINGAPSAVVIINEQQIVLEWNPKAEVIFGFSSASVVGKPLADIIIPKQYREAHARGMEHFLSTGEGPVLNKTIELTALHQMGHTFPINLSISNVKTESGWVFIAFIADISDYKQLQEEVIRREAQLLQSRLINKKQDEFLSLASHELRTPLTTLKAYLQLMDSEAEKNEQPSQTPWLPKALASTSKLEKLIADLLNVSKIKADRLDYHLEFFNIGELVHECVEDLGQTNKTHQIKIVETVQQECEADRLRVEQVLTNLITNAIKYSPNEAEVEVGLTLQDKEVLIYVRDFGIGISESNRQSLFELFYRAEDSAPGFQGLGIGLFLSKKIVERHQGKIWVESGTEKGSCFYFTLPLSQKEGAGTGSDGVEHMTAQTNS